MARQKGKTWQDKKGKHGKINREREPNYIHIRLNAGARTLCIPHYIGEWKNIPYYTGELKKGSIPTLRDGHTAERIVDILLTE